MKYLPPRSFLLLITISFMDTTDVKRFLVVSNLAHAERFYFWIRDTSSRPETDVRVKRQICEDITSNNFFLRRREYPLEKRTTLDILIRHRSYDYPADKIKVFDGVTENEEVVFVCLTRHGRVGVARYYISNEYNLNALSNAFKSYMAGRFVFRKMKNTVQPQLVALAEVPAEVISYPEHNIDNYYLQRWEKYTFAKVALQNDPLCKLPRMEWHRICVSVFNSKHFEGKITISNSDENKGYCERKTLSLRKDYGRGDAPTFDEWMLNCRSKDGYTKEVTHFWLSHAYQTDQIFVYSSSLNSENVFLESLAFNVRITFNPVELYPSGETVAGRHPFYTN